MGAPLLWLCCALLLRQASAEPGPLVRTKQGPVRGLYLTAAGGRPFAAFRGVPYARPPVGPLRFQRSLPLERWPGVWDAREYGSPCLQYDFTFSPEQERVVGDEDCLFVNVFSPKLPSEKNNDLLDVFVYIHGGAFVHGAASLYGPKFLMDRDVVAVTFNYRLGVLGFLSTEDKVLPGNNGLKDQSLALKWINENIKAFGGNPQKITISGTSAGGASVHYHYLSPFSKGLFQKGLSFSGCALNPWAHGYNHKAKTERVAELVGCETKTSQELVDCLKTRPARKIVEQTQHFQVWRFNPFNPFGPIIPEPGNEPFLAKHPLDIILSGEVQDLPWITSVTTEEGLYPVAEFAAKDYALEELNEKFDDIAPHLFHYNYTMSLRDKKELASKIREFYLHGKQISAETRRELIQMVGDRLFVVDVERTARLMASVNTQPVYFYVFSYRGADSISNFMSKTDIDMGAAHGDDTAYIMQLIFCDTEKTEADRSVSQLMLDICTNFANTGNPTPKGRNVFWKPLNPQSELINYINIPNSKRLEIKSSEDLGNRKFWDSLPLHEAQRNINRVKKRDEF